MKRIILGLGNDLLQDDAIALLAIRKIQQQVTRLDIDICECSVSGLYLIDYLEGYDHALLVDAMVSGTVAPGTIIQFSVEYLDSVPRGCSPHYIGLPQALTLARQRGVSLPSMIDVIAIEVEDPYTFSTKLSEGMQKSVDPLVEAIRLFLRDIWQISIEK